jgi:hypothetical protein
MPLPRRVGSRGYSRGALWPLVEFTRVREAALRYALPDVAYRAARELVAVQRQANCREQKAA